MQYTKELTRLFKHPKKHSMFRITKLRYILLHIFLLSCILIIPNSIQYVNITQNISSLAHEQIDELPTFKIEQNKMRLSKEKLIPLNYDQTVLFTKSDSHEMKENQLIVFKPSHIEVSNYNEHTKISYGSLSSLVENDSDLKSFLNTLNDSKYFYLLLVIILLLSIQFISLSFKIGILALIGHIISKIVMRKSRYMTWFKMITFKITIPTLLLLIGILLSNHLIIAISWCIILFDLIVTIFYLPIGKKKMNQPPQ